MKKAATVAKVERRINHKDEPYLIVSHPSGMHDDEVATFSGPNAESRALRFAELVYPDQTRIT